MKLNLKRPLTSTPWVMSTPFSTLSGHRSLTNREPALSLAKSRHIYTATIPPRDPDSSPYPFRVFHDVPSLRQYRTQLLKQGRTVGLVPTMGALHDGHLSLISVAAHENTDVFVSIFVNPTQFGPKEDLATYPRTWDTDVAQMISLDEKLAFPNTLGRITGVFAPNVKTMYPTLLPSSEIDGDGSFVSITPLARRLEGASRPVFFRGVATVCTKLFNIVQPDRVYFGQKDVQQSVVIRRMVQDFHMATDVRVVSTTREQDGLAMSSRNVYLGTRRRRVAPVLNAALRAAQDVYLSGGMSRDGILAAAWAVIEAAAKEQENLPASQRALFKVDYISLAEITEMAEVVDRVEPSQGAILSGTIIMLPVEGPGDEAERVQKPVRLIDNIILEPQVS